MIDEKVISEIESIADDAAQGRWYKEEKDEITTIYSNCPYNGHTKIAEVYHYEDAEFLARAYPEVIIKVIAEYKELKNKVFELEKEADWLSKLLAVTSPQNASAPVTPQFWRNFAKLYVGSKIAQTEEIDNG